MSANIQDLLFKVSLLDKMSPELGPMMSNVDKATNHMKSGFMNIGLGTAGIPSVGFTLEKITHKAIAFESAMADVNKVVEFSNPTGLKSFGQDILNMSKTIPIAAEGLAQIAASGGQLGLNSTQLPDFVDVTSKMSIAFDMLPQQAGESMAKLSNIYSIPINKMSQLGDAINHLSDNSDAKAADIVNVMGRIGGVSTQFGLTATQASALSGTFLAMGSAPEVAATSINSLLMKLQTADAQGAKFQRTLLGMGINSKAMAASIKSSPQQALSGFLAKLKELDSQTRATALTNIVGTGFSDDISLLVGGLDKYNKALGLVGDKYKFLGSMEKEFQARSNTTANKIQLMSNRWDRLMVNFGSLMLPGVIGAIDNLNSIIDPVADKIGRWSSLFPNLAGAVGSAISFVFTLTAGISALSIALGVGKFLTGGFNIAWTVLKFTMGPFTTLIPAIGHALKIIFLQMKGGTAFMTAANFAWQVFTVRLKASLFWTKAYATGVWAMNVATKAASIGMGIFNLVMAANPFYLIIGGIVSLGAAIIALTGNWDNATNTVSRFFDKISSLGGITSKLPDFMVNFLSSSDVTAPKSIAPPAAINQVNNTHTQRGNVSEKIAGMINNSKTSSIGTVHLHNYGQAPNGQQLVDDLAMAAG